MATSRIILFASKTLKDGTHPIMLRVTKDRKRKHLSLGYSCKSNQWDKNRCRFNSRYRDKDTRDSHNLILVSYEKKAASVLDEFAKEFKDFSLDEFERKFIGAVKKITVESFFSYKADELLKNNRVGYADVFRYTKNAVRRFHKGDLRFNEITSQFLNGFESYLIGTGCSGNSISVYMRTFRTLYNEAIKQGFAKIEQYPFKSKLNPNGYDVSAVEQKTAKRAINKFDIEKIKALDITVHPELINAKNLFLFSFYNRGMNFTDIAYLTEDNIHGDRLIYSRKKTRGKKTISIRIRPEVKEIIDFYFNGKYLFPILDDNVYKTSAQKKTRIKTALKKFNQDLKDIAEICEIPIKLTSYVARHSYATILKKSGVSTSVISEGLGHNSEKTTQIYLDSFENDVLDQADKLL